MRDSWICLHVVEFRKHLEHTSILRRECTSRGAHEDLSTAALTSNLNEFSRVRSLNLHMNPGIQSHITQQVKSLAHYCTVHCTFVCTDTTLQTRFCTSHHRERRQSNWEFGKVGVAYEARECIQIVNSFLSNCAREKDRLLRSVSCSSSCSTYPFALGMTV